MRINYWQDENADPATEEAGISVTHAKKLLREKGGVAFTLFFDRSGSFVESRQITLAGNNTTKVKLVGTPL